MVYRSASALSSSTLATQKASAARRYDTVTPFVFVFVLEITAAPTVGLAPVLMPLDLAFEQYISFTNTIFAVFF